MISIDQFERLTLEEWWANAQEYEKIHPQAHIYAWGHDGGQEFKYQYLKHNHPKQIPSVDHMEETMRSLDMEWDDTVGFVLRAARKLGFRMIPLIGWGLGAKDIYDVISQK